MRNHEGWLVATVASFLVYGLLVLQGVSGQWRNYVRRGEAAASGRQAAGGAAKFNQNYLVGL